MGSVGDDRQRALEQGLRRLEIARGVGIARVTCEDAGESIARALSVRSVTEWIGTSRSN